jgi:hypothetical protein
MSCFCSSACKKYLFEISETYQFNTVLLLSETAAHPNELVNCIRSVLTSGVSSQTLNLAAQEARMRNAALSMHPYKSLDVMYVK